MTTTRESIGRWPSGADPLGRGQATTADAQWAETLITRPGTVLSMAVCVGCIHAGAEGWTDLGPGLTSPAACAARACDHCGVRTCLTAADGDVLHISTDDCTGRELCSDPDCRQALGCRGCRDCGDPDDFPGGRDR